MQLVRDGSSWSGHERNCSFLNSGDGEGSFVSASAISGLDFPDDGRRMAIVDWDQDGDLDLWLRNRTAPRLRLMINRSSRKEDDRFIAFKLVGKQANRDAIGAVVRLKLQVDGAVRHLVRSVSAGEMFLSQSSKWLHFGLSDDARLTGVNVLWPGGEEQSFPSVPPGKRYIVEQGDRPAEVVNSARKSEIALEPRELPAATQSSGQASIILPAALPLPISSYIDSNGEEATLPIAKAAQLLVLWSAQCPHCKLELKQLAKRPPGAGVKFFALCVDSNSLATREAAKQLLADTGYVGAWGMAPADSLERVQVLQQALFDKTPTFAVPISFLLRPGNEIVSIYRGQLSFETIAYDVQHVVPASDAMLRNLAPPFPGRWFTMPAALTFPPTMIARRIQARYPEDAVAYLQLAAAKAHGAERKALITELGRKHYSLARKFVSKRRVQEAEHHYTRSLQANPDNAAVHNDFGTTLAQMGRLAEAEKHFAEAIRLQPDYPLAKKNLGRARQLLRQSGQ